MTDTLVFHLKDPKSDREIAVWDGWNTRLFFFSGFFGYPLFGRGLTKWGALFVILICAAVGFIIAAWDIPWPTQKAMIEGIPLGLPQWQAILLIIKNLLAHPKILAYVAVLLLFMTIAMPLQVWMGLRGNRMTAQRLLGKGWRFVEPDSPERRALCAVWGIPASKIRDGTERA